MILRRLPKLLRPFRVLGIESSADDSAAAIVSSDRRIWSNVVEKQHHIHVLDGGIHPLKAQLAHTTGVPIAIHRALKEAGLTIQDVDAIAYTRGPGMYGCLSVGVHAARAIAVANDKPLVGINHMQAHALTPLLTEGSQPEPPFLNLLVSGGHTMIVLTTKGEKDYHHEILATTVDESIGDAYDRTASMLRIPWLEGQGAGPSLEAYAKPDPEADKIYATLKPFTLPMPGEMAFSYAGIKTQVRTALIKICGGLDQPVPVDIARALSRRFQEAAITTVVKKLELALKKLENGALTPDGTPLHIKTLVASGGVASNTYLRQQLQEMLDRRKRGPNIRLCFPPVPLCTDNAAMIAWAGVLRLQQRDGVSDPLDQPIRSKWPIDEID